MVRLVSPDRVVYTISSEDAISSLVAHVHPSAERAWRNHLVGNLSQLCGFRKVGEGRPNRSIASNWVRLESVVWIRLDGAHEYVPLVGTVKHMYESVMQLRSDYNNTQNALGELLPTSSGKQKKLQVPWALGKRGGPFWRVVTPPSSLQLLVDGDCLTKVNGPPSSSTEQQVCAQWS